MSRPFTKEEAERNLQALKNTSDLIAKLQSELKADNDAAEAKEAQRKAELEEIMKDPEIQAKIAKIKADANAEYEYNKARGWSNE